MRLNLIPHAEVCAKNIILELGLKPGSLDVVEMAFTYVEDSILSLDKGEMEDFLEYVDYLTSEAELEVKLPKVRL